MVLLSSDNERVSLATGAREFHREMEDGLEKEDDLEKGRKFEG